VSDSVENARPLADLATTRRSYEAAELLEQSLAPTWLEQLTAWYEQASQHPHINEPNAMQVATVDADCLPDVRTVLARGFDSTGVVFYTNYSSVKGVQLEARPYVAAAFAWLPMERQVRFRGPVRRVSRSQTEAYFASRPRGAQLATWASPQSQIVGGRQELEDRLAELTADFGDSPIGAPPDWGGYHIEVTEMEFWQGRQWRLHDRLRFRRLARNAAEADQPEEWIVERLAP
jgi:pyridoxamine 5'-phosphate oxidase